MRTELRGKLLAAGVGIVVALVAAEVTFLIVQPMPEFERISGRHPMARWAHIDGFCAYRGIPGEYLSHQKTINRDGFFSTPEISREKGPRTLRIAFLGGSSTAGTVPVLPDEETWPWLAARELDRLLPDRDVDFINAAVPGYSTFESYGRLWSRLRFFEPDVVVVYHGWNDMYYFGDTKGIHRWRVLEDGNWTFEQQDRLRRIVRPPLPMLVGWSSLLSYVHRTIFTELPSGEVGRGGPARALAADFDPAGPEIFRQHLQLMIAAQEVLGFELHVAKQATLAVADLDRETRERCGYQLHGFDHDAHVRAFRAIYAIVDEELPKERVIDLTHLSGSTENLLDHVHLTPLGARLVSEAVATHLAR